MFQMFGTHTVWLPRETAIFYSNSLNTPLLLSIALTTLTNIATEQKQKRYHKHRKNITIPVYICTHTENHAILLIYKIDKHRKRLYVCNIYIYTYIYICICVCVCMYVYIDR